MVSCDRASLGLRLVADFWSVVANTRYVGSCEGGMRMLAFYSGVGRQNEVSRIASLMLEVDAIRRGRIRIRHSLLLQYYLPLV